MELSQDTLTVVMFVLSSITAGLASLLTFLFKRTSVNERNLMQHKLDAAEKYVQKKEINDLGLRLESKVEELLKKVD